MATRSVFSVKKLGEGGFPLCFRRTFLAGWLDNEGQEENLGAQLYVLQKRDRFGRVRIAKAPRKCG